MQFGFFIICYHPCGDCVYAVVLNNCLLNNDCITFISIYMFEKNIYVLFLVQTKKEKRLNRIICREFGEF